jgi:hypothetical protein
MRARAHAEVLQPRGFVAEDRLSSPYPMDLDGSRTAAEKEQTSDVFLRHFCTTPPSPHQQVLVDADANLFIDIRDRMCISSVLNGNNTPAIPPSIHQCSFPPPPTPEENGLYQTLCTHLTPLYASSCSCHMRQNSTSSSSSITPTMPEPEYPEVEDYIHDEEYTYVIVDEARTISHRPSSPAHELIFEGCLEHGLDCLPSKRICARMVASLHAQCLRPEEQPEYEEVTFQCPYWSIERPPKKFPGGKKTCIERPHSNLKYTVAEVDYMRYEREDLGSKPWDIILPEFNEQFCLIEGNMRRRRYTNQALQGRYYREQPEYRETVGSDGDSVKRTHRIRDRNCEEGRRVKEREGFTYGLVEAAPERLLSYDWKIIKDEHKKRASEIRGCFLCCQIADSGLADLLFSCS